MVARAADRRRVVRRLHLDAVADGRTHRLGRTCGWMSAVEYPASNRLSAVHNARPAREPCADWRGREPRCSPLRVAGRHRRRVVAAATVATWRVAYRCGGVGARGRILLPGLVGCRGRRGIQPDAGLARSALVGCRACGGGETTADLRVPLRARSHQSHVGRKRGAWGRRGSSCCQPPWHRTGVSGDGGPRRPRHLALCVSSAAGAGPAAAGVGEPVQP